jgi:hypothetical protein
MRLVSWLAWFMDWLFSPCGIGMRRTGNGANDMPRLLLSLAFILHRCRYLGVPPPVLRARGAQGIALAAPGFLISSSTLNEKEGRWFRDATVCTR